ncbi:hypothetical protein GIB67_041878 [Kingdonia uniflora]|uniref:SAM domain-containing protein n=1 Tax=Kingdonia uniflora TaxID=39325 RepID=A0A7J7L5T1_9MAGN|nr:hypothetical protein GIB67_041878 [Kingdonia uniflora]
MAEELQLPEHTTNTRLFFGAPLTETPNPSLGSKRQRRPSVRLSSVSHESYLKRKKQQWSSHKDTGASKTRSLRTRNETLEVPKDKYASGSPSVDVNGDLDDLVTIGSRRVRDLRGKMKRGRSNRVLRDVERVELGERGEGFSGGDNVESWYRDFDPERSKSPLEEERGVGVLESGAGDELDDPSYAGGARDWECGTGMHAEKNGASEERGRFGVLDDGIRMWLIGLGLGQYAPMFEIHEVDEEVLPLLTLEDLKDMGIHAVGSRRKLYCSIQKLGKGFS